MPVLSVLQSEPTIYIYQYGGHEGTEINLSSGMHKKISFKDTHRNAPNLCSNSGRESELCFLGQRT